MIRDFEEKIRAGLEAGGVDDRRVLGVDFRPLRISTYQSAEATHTRAYSDTEVPPSPLPVLNGVARPQEVRP